MSTKYFLLSAAIGAAVSYGALEFAADDSDQRDQIATLENRILDLEQLLAEKEEDLADARFFSAGAFAMDNSHAPARSTTKAASASAGQNDVPHADGGGATAAAVPDIQQRVKDLATISDRDPRSFSEKANALLAADASRESVAIVSRGLVDMAENREILPDHELESLYQQQQNPD
ncbi:MAG TPA: hypothetical protein VLC79_04140, partial [Cellvibrio sp.]|nr:hypothetical protein [Cellvibrio sp.]